MTDGSADGRLLGDPRETKRAEPAAARNPRVIAFHLPQFHPIPENDGWWGKGFTEWTNTAKAKPRFWGHYQPHVPADLGFYDLRYAEARAEQARLAQEYGVSAFCYYHYWFAGRRLLERPVQEILRSGEPDFPFCICWANQSWTGIWHGAPKRVLVQQTYPGWDDHRAHFDVLLEMFSDRRYVRVDGKPLFMLYEPRDIPDIERVVDFWRGLASKAGLPGLHVVGWSFSKHTWDPRPLGLDASVSGIPHFQYGRKRPVHRLIESALKWCGLPTIYLYRHLVDDLVSLGPTEHERYPCVIPNWDNTARSGRRGLVLHGSTPELFRVQVRDALTRAMRFPPDHRLVFVKSWNEWAEGNHLEPDLRDGHGYLEVVREELERIATAPVSRAPASA